VKKKERRLRAFEGGVPEKKKKRGNGAFFILKALFRRSEGEKDGSFNFLGKKRPSGKLGE